MLNELDLQIANLYKSGLSVQQVADQLSISHSKVQYSLEKQAIPRRNRSVANTLLYITKFGKKQCLIKTKLTAAEENLRIAGTMLYWGEGTKSGNSVVFSNSDPDMISEFLKFLREICSVDESRLRILLHLYPDQDENKLKLFWSKATKISLNQFSKTYFHSRNSGTYNKISVYGTASVRYSDKELLNVINNWISEYRMPV